jgi:aspartyl-tRNA synthetase
VAYRDAWCGTIDEALIGKRVKVAGWVHRSRDHGGLIFIDLRDRTGLVQLVVEAAKDPALHERAQELRGEYVMWGVGDVVARSPERINPNLASGKVEIVLDELQILCAADTPPFFPEDDIDVDETLRLKFRYIDLRRPKMYHNLLLRSQVVQAVRRYLGDQGFIDVETPILTKSTPEGARDFLVPSRLQPGEFYALPQSPQLFKQLLMFAGLERYYQIARAFRDEDLRADRQPEHTQIDIEMSFIDEEDIQNVVEGMFAAAFKETLDVDLPHPFRRLEYADAMARYGSDKPDLRWTSATSPGPPSSACSPEPSPRAAWCGASALRTAPSSRAKTSTTLPAKLRCSEPRVCCPCGSTPMAASARRSSSSWGRNRPRLSSSA